MSQYSTINEDKGSEKASSVQLAAVVNILGSRSKMSTEDCSITCKHVSLLGKNLIFP